MRHLLVRRVDTKGKWRNIFFDKYPCKRKGWGKIYPKVTTDMISMS